MASDTSEFFDGYINTFWFIIVTMVTVGYGDGYPKTHVGRFIVLWVCVVGTLLVSLMVVALTNSSALSNGEKRVFNKVEITGLKQNTKIEGAELIYNVFKLFVINKKLTALESEEPDQEQINQQVLKKFGMLSKCREIVQNFDKKYRLYKSCTSTPEDLLLDLHEKNEQKFRQVYVKL